MMVENYLTQGFKSLIRYFPLFAEGMIMYKAMTGGGFHGQALVVIEQVRFAEFVGYQVRDFCKSFKRMMGAFNSFKQYAYRDAEYARAGDESSYDGSDRLTITKKRQFKKGNPYEFLGVTRATSADEIKKTYRKMAFDNHPDRFPDDKDKEQRFKDANNAYEDICNGW